MKKLLIAAVALMALACKGDPDVVPASIALSHTSKALAFDETLQLTATVLPDNAKDRTVRWSNPRRPSTRR